VSQRAFFDTNVFVYADDQAAPLAKRERARELLRDYIASRTAVVSTQVLQEFFVVCTRKLGVPEDMARRRIEIMSRLDVVTIHVDLILEAVDLHRLHAISFWDALVVRAAAAAGCPRLFTEDLQHGQMLGGVRIESPFEAA